VAAAEIVPLRPEIVGRHSEVLIPEVLAGQRPTASVLFDRLASDVRTAVDRLVELDHPEALEVSRWLRVRLAEVIAERVRA
jgi:hypothetical protein